MEWKKTLPAVRGRYLERVHGRETAAEMDVVAVDSDGGVWARYPNEPDSSVYEFRAIEGTEYLGPLNVETVLDVSLPTPAEIAAAHREILDGSTPCPSCGYPVRVDVPTPTEPAGGGTVSVVGSHFREVCPVCGNVVRQCRCPGPKNTVVSATPCPTCTELAARRRSGVASGGKE